MRASTVALGMAGETARALHQVLGVGKGEGFRGVGAWLVALGKVGEAPRALH